MLRTYWRTRISIFGEYLLLCYILQLKEFQTGRLCHQLSIIIHHNSLLVGISSFFHLLIMSSLYLWFQGMGFKGLFNVLSTKPVLNKVSQSYVCLVFRSKLLFSVLNLNRNISLNLHWNIFWLIPLSSIFISIYITIL